MSNPVHFLSAGVADVAPNAIQEHPDNPNVGDMETIAESIETDGFYGRIIVSKRTGFILAGNHRYRALVKAGAESIPVEFVDVDREGELRILAKDNQIAALAHRDDGKLAVLLAELSGTDNGFRGIGYQPEDLADLLASLGDEPPPASGFRDEGKGDETPSDDEETPPTSPSDGSLLALVNVTIDDPTHKVERGDRWQLGGRHLMMIENVLTGWKVWAPALEALGEEAIFCPHPGPMVPLCTRAEKQPLCLVQPDIYVAGHVLDRYVEIHGLDSVVKL